MKHGVIMTLMNGVMNNQPFVVNVESREIKLGGKYIIKKGEVCDAYKLDVPEMELEEILEEIEDFYVKVYKASRPSTKEVNRRVIMFKAKLRDELDEREWLTGIDRNLCRVILEGTIICRLINGSLYWDPEIMGGNLYWQSKRDPELVLFRNYLGL